MTTLMVPVEDRLMSPREILDSLTSILAAILAASCRTPEAGDRAWQVLSHRKGLLGPTHTLEEIGIGLGLTRERVRQIEKEAHQVLTTFASDHFTGEMRLAPLVVESLERTFAAGPSDERPVLREHQLLSGLGLGPALDAVAGRRLAYLLGLRGVERIELNPDRASLWALPTPSARRLANAVPRIESHLATTAADGATALEVSIALNKLDRSHPIDPGVVGAALPLLKAVEVLSDGRLRARWESLARPQDQAYRLLVEAGTTLRLDDMLRSINATRPSRRDSLVRGYLSNLVSTDDRFVPIGRTGLWGLVGRDDAVAVNVWERVLSALFRLAAPSQAQAITAAVGRSDIDRALVITHLHQLRGRQVEQLKDGTWVLSSWKEARDSSLVKQAVHRPKTTTPAQAAVDAELARILSTSSSDGLPIGEAVTGVAKALSRKWPSAYYYVNRSQFVTVSGPPRARRVRLGAKIGKVD